MEVLSRPWIFCPTIYKPNCQTIYNGCPNVRGHLICEDSKIGVQRFEFGQFDCNIIACPMSCYSYFNRVSLKIRTRRSPRLVLLDGFSSFWFLPSQLSFVIALCNFLFIDKNSDEIPYICMRCSNFPVQPTMLAFDKVISSVGYTINTEYFRCDGSNSIIILIYMKAINTLLNVSWFTLKVPLIECINIIYSFLNISSW